MSDHRDEMPGDTGDVDDSGPGHFSSGVALAIAGTFLFALKSIFIKLAYAQGAEPTSLLVLRLFFAAPFYVAVLFAIRGERPDGLPIDRKLIGRALLLGFLGYYIASYLDLSGLQHITAQLERLTLFTYPAIVALLAWAFLGEGLNRRLMASIVLCYLGVALMYVQEQSLTGGTDVALGVTLVAGSAISYAVYIFLAKPTMKRIGSRRFTSWAMIGSTVFIGVHFAISSELSDLTGLPASVYGYAVVLAIVCTLIPSFMINESIMRIGATRTAVIGTVGPVLTMLLAITVLKEPSSAGHFAGMATAVAGVSLVARK